MNYNKYYPTHGSMFNQWTVNTYYSIYESIFKQWIITLTIQTLDKYEFIYDYKIMGGRRNKRYSNLIIK